MKNPNNPNNPKNPNSKISKLWVLTTLTLTLPHCHIATLPHFTACCRVNTSIMIFDNSVQHFLARIYFRTLQLGQKSFITTWFCKIVSNSFIRSTSYFIGNQYLPDGGGTWAWVSLFFSFKSSA
jgi:hypothetical protein